MKISIKSGVLPLPPDFWPQEKPSSMVPKNHSHTHRQWVVDQGQLVNLVVSFSERLSTFFMGPHPLPDSDSHSFHFFRVKSKKEYCLFSCNYSFLFVTLFEMILWEGKKHLVGMLMCNSRHLPSEQFTRETFYILTRKWRIRTTTTTDRWTTSESGIVPTMDH